MDDKKKPGTIQKLESAQSPGKNRQQLQEERNFELEEVILKVSEQ